MKRDRKTWVLLKRGLVNDPKHREAIGNRIWLYMHIIDKANWEHGKVFEWRDKDEADDMGLSWRTLQTQRQELESMGYIECKNEGDKQTITINKWVDPRSYSGETLNTGGGTSNHVRGGTMEGTSKSTQAPYRESRTPTLDSEINNQESETDFSKIITAFNRTFRGRLSTIQPEIELAISTYTYDWVYQALNISKNYNSPNWNYAKAILENWRESGGPNAKKESGATRQFTLEELGITNR